MSEQSEQFALNRLAYLLNRLGGEAFRDTITNHRLVDLLQRMGLDFSCQFTWYEGGFTEYPFSQQLHERANTLKGLEHIDETLALQAEGSDLRERLYHYKPPSLSNSDWLGFLSRIAWGLPTEGLQLRYLRNHALVTIYGRAMSRYDHVLEAV